MSINEKQLSKLLYYFAGFDGGVYPSGNNCRFVMNMREDNSDYVEWVKNTISEFTSSDIRSVIQRGNRKPLISLTSKTHPKFTTIRERLYTPDGKKILDPHQLTLLDAEALSIIFMADGGTGMDKGKYPEIKLHTKGYSYFDNLALSKAIFEKLNIRTNVNRHNQYFFLRVKTADLILFIHTVKPFVLPSFLYKLERLAPAMGDDIVCASQECEEVSRNDQPCESSNNSGTEVTSSDDSDVCNLGSINMAACSTIAEFKNIVAIASKFLVCGTLGAQLPYEKVYRVREKNRRLGLGLMGVHEWLLQRGYRYECVPELKEWLQVYRDASETSANSLCDALGISRPVAYRALAPTGTIGILAGTTTGIEPIFETAYKRRYLKSNGWNYEYVVDNTAKLMVDTYGLDPESIETASDLSRDVERRIAFQADVQDYVDMSISSTINIPTWGSVGNNEDLVEHMSTTVAKYAPRLRGLTFYPDGSRGGQPLTKVGYYEALKHEGVVYEENSACLGGVCGI